MITDKIPYVNKGHFIRGSNVHENQFELLRLFPTTCQEYTLLENVVKRALSEIH
jgi:hypothetical protein